MKRENTWFVLKPEQDILPADACIALHIHLVISQGNLWKKQARKSSCANAAQIKKGP